MDDDSDTAAHGDEPVSDAAFLHDWPLRPWLLAGIGALAGLVIHLIVDSEGESPWGAAIAGATFFAALAAAFVLRPQRWIEAAIFALGLGLVMGGISYLAVDSGDHVAGEEFAFAAGIFFSVLAVPLFQADFHRRRWATPYVETHFHVWTDAITAGGSFAFMLLAFALLWLVDGLFGLVGLNFVEDLLQSGWFAGMFFGATFGAAMGVLRNQLGIIGTLQRVVMLVFALLAVPFALAILVFLAILLLSGGSALWEATDSATPVLLTCALGCFVLANAVFRDDDASRSDNVVMQAAALVLAGAIFPLTVFAAISMGIRIDQYGLAPERLWALVAIVIATAYGLAYWVGLARGRLAGWAHYLRRANLHLAVASCVVALVLALPLLDFGAISASNQVARLQGGKVTAEEFDFDALRWDFGDAGREALARLAEGEGNVAELAAAAQAQTERVWDYYDVEPTEVDEGKLRVEPEDPEVRAFVMEQLAREPWACDQLCAAIDIGPDAAGNRRIAVVQDYSFNVYTMGVDDGEQPPTDEAFVADHVDLEANSTIEVRTVRQRYIFIDGKPVNHPLDDVTDAEVISPAD